MRSTVELRDGSRIRIRPIGPGDRDLLERGFGRLGAESRYRRFFGPMSHLTEAQLDYLTDVDHHDHEALIAIDRDSGEAVGVARFVRVDDAVAEPAVVVVDSWQGRGVGTVLLDELADRAREEGIRSFAAAVLAENDTAIAALSRLGDTEMSNQGSEVELHIALEDAPGAAPSLRRLLRDAAARTIDPSVSLWQRLAVARRGRD